MSFLLRHSVSGYSALEDHYADRLAEQMQYAVGARPNPGERRSWSRSIPTLVADLKDAGLGGVEMLVEYRLPLSSKRADVILAGNHPKTGAPSYAVVELKQWSAAARFEDNPELVLVDAYGGRPVSHPATQVRDYCEYLTDFAAVLDDDSDAVAGIAYLHNATEQSVSDLLEVPGDRQGRLFTGDRRGELTAYLRTLFDGQSGVEAADALLGSAIRPSRQLLSVAAEEVQRREMFVLLDEQRDAYNYVLHAVRKAGQSNTKTAIVVSGGPGSGKSVIALSVMGELARQGRSVVHATGSQSFTKTLRKVAGARNRRVQKTFQYFNSFMTTEPNSLECVIYDEAHRIRETSANRFTSAANRTGRSQIDELLSVTRTPVFLLDQNQVVRPGELGTAQDIEQAAEERGINVMHVDLSAQFRSGGSLAYIQWVADLLHLGDRVGTPWGGDPNFSVDLFDSPAALENWLSSKQEQGFGARMAAGYCWPWSDPREDKTLVPDVVIGDWSRPWNVKGERAIGGNPPSHLWASTPEGFGQVGCVYTAQGFEYDFAGVIIGPDLVWRDSEWHFDRAANRDPAFRSRKTVSDEMFARLVKNVYKVLLTRGMQGVGIYAVDPETNEHLRGLIY